MTQHLDLVLLSIATMDREGLKRLRRACSTRRRVARLRCSTLWMRNRVAYVSGIICYLLLVMGAGVGFLGNSQPFSFLILFLLVAAIWVVTRLSASYFGWEAFLDRRRDEERVARETLDAQLRALHAIGSRFRQLDSTTPG